MKVESISIGDLSQDPANARKHGERNLQSIIDSLRAFGQQKPIVVDKRGIVIAGNGTLDAAKSIGWKKIDIVRTDLEGSQATAFGIADNRTSELAEWDGEVLGSLLDSLDDELRDILAFDEDELADLIPDSPVDIVEDEVPEPPTEPITKPGDLILLGDHRVLCGDSTNAEDVERLMDGEKVDLCFTSPPYNSGNGGYQAGLDPSKTKKFYVHNKDNKTEDEWVEFCDKVLQIIESNLRDEDSVVAWNVMYTANCRSGYGRAMFSGTHGLKVKETICWDKSNGYPTATKGILSRNWELVFVLSSGKTYATTQKENECRWAKWDIPRPAQQHDIHKATFPVELPARAIEDFGGDVVFDPFLGSGTTLIAAEQLNRRCYGMEIDPTYCDVIVGRWEQLTGKKAERISR